VGVESPGAVEGDRDRLFEGDEICTDAIGGISRHICSPLEIMALSAEVERMEAARLVVLVSSV